MSFVKFHQLPVGERFEMAGESYIKSSPVLAQHLATGKPRMIPRSAAVAIPGGGESVQVPVADLPLDPSVVKAAAAAFHEECRNALERFASAPGEEAREQAEAAMRDAFDEFMRKL